MDTNMPGSLEHEVGRLLDALASGDIDVRRDAAARVAHLGVWNRRNTLPRGSIWAAAPLALPAPPRLGELAAASTDADLAVRGQAVAALGHWADASVIPTIAALLTSTTDETLRMYCLAALRNIGGPAAVPALVDAASSSSPAVARAALQGLETLLTGGAVDDSSAPSVIRQPPPEYADQFIASVGKIVRALDRIVADDTRGALCGRARDIVELIERQPVARRTVRVTPAQLDAFLENLDNLSATPLGEHLGTEDILASLGGALADADQQLVDAHLISCATCARATDELTDALAPWEGSSGKERVAALVARIRDLRRSAEPVANVPQHEAVFAPAAMVAAFALKVRQLTGQLARGEWVAGLRAQFEQLRATIDAEMTPDFSTAAAAPVLAEAAAAQGDRESPVEHELLQRRMLIDPDGRLVVLLASQDLDLEGIRIAVTIGDLRQECVLERVANDQLLGEVQFTHDAWSMLPVASDVDVKVLDPATFRDAD